MRKIILNMMLSIITSMYCPLIHPCAKALRYLCGGVRKRKAEYITITTPPFASQESVTDYGACAKKIVSSPKLSLPQSEQTSPVHYGRIECSPLDKERWDPFNGMLFVYPRNVMGYIQHCVEKGENKQAAIRRVVEYFYKDHNIAIIQVLYENYGRMYPDIFYNRCCITYVSAHVVKKHKKTILARIESSGENAETIRDYIKKYATTDLACVWTCDDKWRVIRKIVEKYSAQYAETILNAVLAFENDACLEEIVVYLHKKGLLNGCSKTTRKAARQSATRQHLPCRTILGEPDIYWHNRPILS